MNSDWPFIEVCSYGSDWQYSSIGWNNGITLNRRQAIIWTNADPVHWRIYAVLSGDELNVLFLKCNVCILIQNSPKFGPMSLLALILMPKDPTDDKSTLVQVIAWLHQTTSHYLNHGSHTFSEIKFKDFSRTFQGQNYIFQGLSNGFLGYCKCVILWWNNLSYTKLQYSQFIFEIYSKWISFFHLKRHW